MVALGFRELGHSVFIPLGQLGGGRGDLSWLNGLSSAFLALAYFSIPIIAFSFVLRRDDLPFPRIFFLMGAFFVLCGAMHLFEVLALWHSFYFLSSGVKLAAAVISFIFIFAIIRVVPEALQRPSPASLRRLTEELESRTRARLIELVANNERLEREVRQHEQAAADVRRLNDSLEHRVVELEALLDLLPVGVGVARDPLGRELCANRAFAEMLGLAQPTNLSISAVPAEALAKTKVFEGDCLLRPNELPLQRAASENKQILDCELTIERSDGQRLQLVANAIPLRDAAGQARGAVGVFQDVTNQKIATQERLFFERKQREKERLESLGVLAGGIAQDFNNLLTGILGNSSLARLELPPGHVSVRTALDNLEQSALRATDLCRQMLAYAGKGHFVVQPLDLTRLVKETSDLLEISVSKKVSLRFNFADGLPSFSGEASQIRQVLMNLVLNASEAIGDRSGVVNIKTGQLRVTREYLSKMAFYEEDVEGTYVYFEVSDNGAGMSTETLARIFDPFYTTKFTGRGLGLAAVLGIVRGHNGAINVYSERNRGTAIKILFPSINVDAPALFDASEFMHEKNSGKLLIIDDESMVRTAAAKILRTLGFEVVTASDGVEGTEIFRRQPTRFAAVLLDLTMPKMDGEEAFRELREIDPGVRVILMSGFDEQDTLDRFTGGSVSGFVPKPFTAEILLTKVTDVLSHVGAMK